MSLPKNKIHTKCESALRMKIVKMTCYCWALNGYIKPNHFHWHKRTLHHNYIIIHKFIIKKMLQTFTNYKLILFFSHAFHGFLMAVFQYFYCCMLLLSHLSHTSLTHGSYMRMNAVDLRWMKSHRLYCINCPVLNQWTTELWQSAIEEKEGSGDDHKSALVIG